jgi:pilus assembly protein FimV
VHKSKLRRISLAVCFALMPFAANAAGLGKLTVISGLGEPLSAEIELLATSPEELSSLSAAIAPEDAYAVQGIERLASHSAIKIEVGKKANGSPILKLSTRQPVNDPFLDMLIQVDWSTGRLLREYTVLLDPPGYSADQIANNNAAVGSTGAASTRVTPIDRDTQPAGQSARGAAKKSKSANARSSGKKITPSPAPVEESPSPSESSSPTSGAEEHTTARGDTLNAIASQMQVEGVSLEQMLVGLYRANKNAFAGNNMNRLKVGQIIRAPSSQDLQSISRKEAAQEVRVQTADWNAYRNKLAGLVAESSAGSENASTQSSGGKITAPAEDKAAPVSNGPRDVVKLSKSDSAASKNGSADGKAMQDKLNSLQEEATAREKSVKEANERTALLEKQVADMQKLLAVKNQAMADIQKNVATPAPTLAPAPKVEPAPKPEVAPEAAKQPAAGAAVVPPPAPPAPDAQAAAPKPEAPATETPPAADKPVAPKKRIIVPPPAPVAETDLIDQVLQDPVLLGGAGGTLLVLLGGTWLFLRNKRKRGLDHFEQGILTSGGLKANTVFGNTAGGTVDTGDTSFLTDFSQSGGAGMIDTHDVDPIAEAEVYMAYGRDAQAEEILKDAIAKEPKRYELHLKLLEILAGRNDSSAFETIAGELYSTLGSDNPTWVKVAEIGRKMEPNNPLYDISSGHEHAAATPSSKLNADDFANAEVMSESSLDFSLDADIDSNPSETSKPSEQASTLDFDLGAQENAPAEETLPEINMLGSEQAPAATLNGDSNQGSNDLDFQLDLSEQAAEADNLSETDKTVQLDVSDFGKTMPGFDMPEFEIAKTPPAEAAASVEPPAEPSFESLPEISFDLPEIGTANSATELNVPEETASLELPDFDKTIIVKSEVAAEDIIFETQPAESASLELPSFDQTTILESELTSEEIVLEAMPEEPSGLDFNFDMDLGSSETASQATTEAEEATKAPEIDLSGISLDFDSAPDNSTDVEEISTATGESADVDTKLDLVTAYMDMGDNEGARELLDEVLKEGGPKQRERAQQMMNSLG